MMFRGRWSGSKIGHVLGREPEPLFVPPIEGEEK
jgi:hypothetical protein